MTTEAPVHRACLLPLALLLLALLPACDLNDHPPDIQESPAPDATASRDVAPDTGATPVACDILTGRWQVTLCDANAANVQFIRAGCQASLSSPAPALNGGTASLRADGVHLDLTLPGGTAGALDCETTPTTTSFAGTCRSATGSCAIAGVRVY